MTKDTDWTPLASVTVALNAYEEPIVCPPDGSMPLIAGGVLSPLPGLAFGAGVLCPYGFSAPFGSLR